MYVRLTKVGNKILHEILQVLVEISLEAGKISVQETERRGAMLERLWRTNREESRGPPSTGSSALVSSPSPVKHAQLLQKLWS